MSSIPTALANAAEFNDLLAVINSIRAANNATIATTGTIWRPPGWKKTPKWTVTVPVSSQPASNYTGDNANRLILPDAIVYVFDAVLRSDQEEGIRMTEFPIQTGGNISDNAYLVQSRVTLEIGMSDAMDAYTAGQWSGSSSSKSVNAYQTLAALKDSRQFVTLATRVKIYPQMLIERITMSDSNATYHALKASITFRQVFVASVNIGGIIPVSTQGAAGTTTTGSSSRPDSVWTTATGTIGTQGVPDSVSSAHMVEGDTLPDLTTLVPGSGVWSSTGVVPNPDFGVLP
jgi:hypothetical protein